MSRILVLVKLCGSGLFITADAQSTRKTKMIAKHHFDNLHDYHTFLGLGAPEHPQFSITVLKANVADASLACLNGNMETSSDFYAISLKHILSGEIHYGRTNYDFRSGSLICTYPDKPCF